MARPRGRPTRYTPEIAEEILQRLADGELLKHICRDPHMPPASTVRRWVLDDREGFAEPYTRARQIGYEGMADEIIEIADDSSGDFTEGDDGRPVVDHEHIQRSRLRVDTRKWMLSKVLPKVYGDKLQHTGDGGEGPMQVIVKRFTGGDGNGD